MEELLKIAIDAAIEAGHQIMTIYNSDDFEINLKDDNSPLTKADIASHKVIMEKLKHTNIPVLSEEGKAIPFDERREWNRLWIVDPIDGTKEFIKKNGEFTVNIALVEDHVPVLGVIFVPALNELYYSNKETGAYKVDNVRNTDDISALMASAERLPIVSDRTNYTVVASRSHMSEETKDFINALEAKHGKIETISKGSSLKLCMVAEGKADCYPRFAPTMEWDTAAGQAICQHAGFDVIDWTTKHTMLYNRENLLNNWFLVQ